MSWSKIQIKQNDGKLVDAQAPVIISASRSTDIPAFYSDWFINRLKAGYVKWKNPFNGVYLYVSFEKMDEVRKVIRVTMYLFVTLFIFACNVNKKTEFYNPIGKDFNSVIEYFEKNEFEYMRSITDLYDNCLVHLDNPCITSYFMFNTENICYHTMWVITCYNIDSATYQLNKRFKKASNDTMKWIDEKKDFVYEIRDRKDGAFILTCTSDKYKYAGGETGKTFLNYYSMRFQYSKNNEITEWFEHFNSFIVPLGDNGKVNGDIIHFRDLGKYQTYKIISDNSVQTKLGDIAVGNVIEILDEKGKNIMFFWADDLSLVSFMMCMECDDGGLWIDFSNIEGQKNQFIVITGINANN